jgi:hypothetical protein
MIFSFGIAFVLISFFLNKAILKQDLEGKLQKLSPKRKLNEEEINSAIRLYKINRQLVASDNLYEIKGRYKLKIFNDIDDLEDRIHFIGIHKIKWVENLQNYIDIYNTAEVIFLTDGKTIIFTLNARFNAHEENEITSCLLSHEKAEGIIEA